MADPYERLAEAQGLYAQAWKRQGERAKRYLSQVSGLLPASDLELIGRNQMDFLSGLMAQVPAQNVFDGSAAAIPGRGPMDIEMAVEVEARGGPTVRRGINEVNVHMVPVGGWNLQGTHIRANLADDPEAMERSTRRYSKVLMEAPQPNTIYAVGPENANPEIWAHEARHASGWSTEHEVRLMDVFTARNFAEYEESLISLYEYSSLSDDPKITLNEFEERVWDKLTVERMINHEAEAYKEQEIWTPGGINRWGFKSSSPYIFSRDEYEKRRKTIGEQRAELKKQGMLEHWDYEGPKLTIYRLNRMFKRAGLED